MSSTFFCVTTCHAPRPAAKAESVADRAAEAGSVAVDDVPAVEADAGRSHCKVPSVAGAAAVEAAAMTSHSSSEAALAAPTRIGMAGVGGEEALGSSNASARRAVAVGRGRTCDDVPVWLLLFVAAVRVSVLLLPRCGAIRCVCVCCAVCRRFGAWLLLRSFGVCVVRCVGDSVSSLLLLRVAL